MALRHRLELKMRSFLSFCAVVALCVPPAAGAASLPRGSWPFEENGGRFSPQVAFATRTAMGPLFVTVDGQVVHSLPAGGDRRLALVERLEGATGNVRGGAPSAAAITLMRGTDRRRLRAYQSLRVAAWPGIESELRLRDGGIERLFRLAPGARAEWIRVRLGGARKLTLDETGGLRVKTPAGELHLSAPVAWQPAPGGRNRPVEIAYRVSGDTYAFVLGPHDPNLPVVIDPLLRSTYVGGTSGDFVGALATDAVSVYAAGGTISFNFPGTGVGSGAAQPTKSGGQDAFVARYSLDLTQLLSATYLGGSGNEDAITLALNGSDVYVAGRTTSTNFPGTAGGAVPAAGGGTYDGFVARLSSDLGTLHQATYFGGSDNDMLGGLAVTASAVYATGFTQSNNIPGTTGAAQASLAGTSDAIAVQFSANLQTLIRATYVGGSLNDSNLSDPAVTADALYLTGTTDSHDFPQTAGGLQPTLMPTDASEAVFVTRLSLDLGTIVQSTYYATEFSHDRAEAIVAAAGDLFVLGQSPGSNLPGTAGGAVPHDNLIDLFVARLSADLTSVVNATYYGGFDDETPGDLIVADGSVFVVGSTASNDLPGTAGGIQPTKVQPADTTNDTLIARFSLDLATLEQATYLGGPVNEEGLDIAAGGGILYIGGSDDSPGFPGTGPGTGGAQEEFAGGNDPGALPDGFIAAVTADLQLTVTASIDDVTLAEGNADMTPFQFTVSLSGPPAAPVEVTVQTVNGSAIAGEDFVNLPPTVLTFTPAGPLTQTVTVNVLGDVSVEPDQQFTVTLSSADVDVADGTGLGTIVNDDLLPATAIPTLSEAGLAALSLLLAGLGLAALRRRRSS